MQNILKTFSPAGFDFGFRLSQIRSPLAWDADDAIPPLLATRLTVLDHRGGASVSSLLHADSTPKSLKFLSARFAKARACVRQKIWRDAVLAVPY